MKGFLAALSFLTILPLPGIEFDDDDIGVATLWFPLVGMVIGGVTAGVAWSLLNVFPLLPVSTVAITVMIAASGGLHTDGLADTADGFFSARPREKMLEIMRDSRIGSMGVIAILVVFMLKLTCLSGMSEQLFLSTLFIAPVAGRCSMAINISLLSYARDTGLAKLFFEKKARWHMLIAIWVLFVLAGLTTKLVGLIAAFCACFASILWAIYCLRKIGGGTGDTLGACCEITETVIILAVCAHPAIESIL